MVLWSIGRVGTKSEVATSPLPSRGFPIEGVKIRNGYITLAFLGVDCLLMEGKNRHRRGMVKKRCPMRARRANTPPPTMFNGVQSLVRPRTKSNGNDHGGHFRLVLDPNTRGLGGIPGTAWREGEGDSQNFQGVFNIFQFPVNQTAF